MAPAFPSSPTPHPMFDEAANMAGVINMMIDISGRKSAEIASQRLAAIVASSDDAILSKDTNGIITELEPGGGAPLRLF